MKVGDEVEVRAAGAIRSLGNEWFPGTVLEVGDYDCLVEHRAPTEWCREHGMITTPWRCRYSEVRPGAVWDALVRERDEWKARALAAEEKLAGTVLGICTLHFRSNCPYCRGSR